MYKLYLVFLTFELSYCKIKQNKTVNNKHYSIVHNYIHEIVFNSLSNQKPLSGKMRDNVARFFLY